MSTKQKIIDALGCALDDISEDRLLDILLDAYEAKKHEIEVLEGANAREREDMYHERERMREEYRCMRSDPLYSPEGVYYFTLDEQRFTVVVRGRKIDLMERNAFGYEKLAMPMKLEDWLRS